MYSIEYSEIQWYKCAVLYVLETENKEYHSVCTWAVKFEYKVMCNESIICTQVWVQSYMQWEYCLYSSLNTN